MCITIYTLHQDCRHKQYQNTSPCNVASRRPPEDDIVLGQAIWLPAEQPKVPPGMLSCKQQSACRPVAGLCQNCVEQLRTSQQQQGQQQQPGARASSSSAGTFPPDNSGPSRSFDSKALQQMRESFIKVSQMQEGTPPPPPPPPADKPSTPTKKGAGREA